MRTVRERCFGVPGRSHFRRPADVSYAGSDGEDEYRRRGICAAGKTFKYWSGVAYTTFSVGVSGSGLSDALIEEREEWNYKRFSSYVD
jgi:hypothetical protein